MTSSHLGYVLKDCVSQFRLHSQVARVTPSVYLPGVHIPLVTEADREKLASKMWRSRGHEDSWPGPFFLSAILGTEQIAFKLLTRRPSSGFTKGFLLWEPMG